MGMKERNLRQELIISGYDPDSVHDSVDQMAHLAEDVPCDELLLAYNTVLLHTSVLRCMLPLTAPEDHGSVTAACLAAFCCYAEAVEPLSGGGRVS
jgi:hypothetical protein